MHTPTLLNLMLECLYYKECGSLRLPLLAYGPHFICVSIYCMEDYCMEDYCMHGIYISPTRMQTDQ